MAINSKLDDEHLNGEIFYTFREPQARNESWRHHYNTAHPHSSLDYGPPAPEVLVAGCANRTSFAGHTSSRAQANFKLT